MTRPAARPEVTGTISAIPEVMQWALESENWIHRWRDADGELHESEGSAQWYFRRRIDAVAFAARKGIRLVEGT